MDLDDCKYEKVETKNEERYEFRPVSYFELYKFSTNFDKMLLVVAVLLGAGSGTAEALFILILGRCVGTIANFENDLLTAVNETDKLKVKENFQYKANDFAIFTCAVALAIFLATYISTSLFNYTAIKQAFKIRELYFSKVLYQDISWHDQISTRDFASRIVDDLQKIQEGINDKAAIAVIQLTIIVVSVLQSLFIGWKLTLVCLISLPISFVMMSFIGKLSANLSVDETEAYEKAAKVADEALTYIKTVVAFNGQRNEIKRYDKFLLLAKRNNIKRYFFIGLTNGVTNFFVCFGMVLSLWYGVRLLMQENENYSIEKIVMVYNSVWTATHNIGATTPFLVMFNAAKAAATNIFSVIDSQPFINQSYAKGTKLTELQGNISFRDVSFSYPARPDVEILKNFSLEIKAGETIALVGSSGCGKSTVLELIQRFYDANRGQICLDDNDIKIFNLKTVRDKIGVVGKKPVIFNGTIAKNIKLGKSNATRAEVEDAGKKSNADSFIQSFTDGYQTVIGERGPQLSADEKQRIAIARVLVRKPTVLLIDDATSALDSNSEAEVQTTLDEISQDCTTVIVSRRLSTIRKANRVVVLENGTVVEEGSHDELMLTKGPYYKLIAAQSTEAGETCFKNSEQNKELPGNIRLKEDQAKTWIDCNLTTVGKILNNNLSPKWCMIAGILCSMTYIVSATGCLYFLGKSLAVMAGANAKHVITQVNIYSGCIFGLALIVGFASLFQSYFIGIVAENLTVNLRHSMFKSMVNQDMKWFDRNENGVRTLSARLAGEPSSVQNAIGFCAGAFINAITAMFSLLFVGVYLCWKLLLSSLGFIPVLLVLLYLEQKALVEENRKSTDVMERSTKLAIEAMSNVRTVASLAVEKTFHNLYRLKLKFYKSVTIRHIHIQGVVYGLSRSAFPLSYLIPMYYGSSLIRNNETNAATVIALTEMFVVYLWLITYSLVYFSNVTRGFVACNRIHELLTHKPETKILSNRKLADLGINQDIQCANLSFSYPTRPDAKVLDGLDLSVPRGKTLALVGPGGCGKSTVIQLLERFYDCDSGNITFAGRDIRKENVAAHRFRMGIVTQKPNLFSRTIRANIAYGSIEKKVSTARIIAAAHKANIHNFITSLPLGYETVLGEKGIQLSDGQKQKIAIARALVRNPEVLLLDEATSALDAESEKVVQEALNKARKKRTCIVTAHRPKTIIDSDLIVVMNKGKVAEKGSHRELMSLQGLYWNLYNLQQQF